MTMAEQLYEVGSKLPPPALAELLDFAEFLRQKCAPPYPAQRISLAELRGWKIPLLLPDRPCPSRKKCAVNGIDYLLDTNFILGLLQSSPDTLALINARQIESHQCAYSAITRMELLEFPGITRAEESLIQEKLAHLTYLPITSAVEDGAIRLRRTYKVKVPDAIIASSALVAGVELLTYDRQLQNVLVDEMAAQTTKTD